MADNTASTGGLTMLRRSPLAAMAREMMDKSITGPRNVRVSESRFTTMISVRVDPGSTAAGAIGDVLGTALSARCGEVSSHAPHSVLWLGPDEWLIVSDMAADLLLPELRSAALDAGDGSPAIVDVSANRTVVELSGAAARAVLEKGCPTDLHPRAFGPGTAIATTLARVPLLLWQVGPTTYRLLPRSSFAQYVASWLLDAMQEFGSGFGSEFPSELPVAGPA
ncbi:MAG TPA: sarcosine oxidase subunit gamma family protein [Nocardioides sp.]|nr:sarcosine oxidase subunit gamma family protein [Nocardioides sp.]